MSARAEHQGGEKRSGRRPEGPEHAKQGSLGQTLKRTVSEFKEDALTDSAAALTYYAVLSIFPALIALVSIVGLVFDPARITKALTDLVSEVGPASAVETFKGPIETLTQSSGTAGVMLIVGIVAALWTASGYVGAFMRASNVIYEVEEGRSFVRIGDAQFDPAFSLRDDVADAGMVGLGFDVEGTPRRRVDLVVDGVSRAILHTRRTARAAGHGAQSTGHAVEGGATWGALGGKLVLDAGDLDHDALIAGVERGIYVLDFWYTRILDPRTQVVSGLTRNGVWLIEDGKIAGALTNMRFTQSYADALGPGAIRAIGSERELHVAGFGTDTLVPSLHLASWNFTGGAKG